MNKKFYLAFLMSVLILSITTSARTTITLKDCKITVTVNIAFYGDGANQSLIDIWEKSAENNFNGDGRTFGECKCPVTFDIVTKLVDSGDKCGDDYSCVEVKKIPPGSSHTSWVRNGANHLDWSGPKENTDGSVTSTSSRTTAEFDNLDTGEVAAHEIGHILGLDDEYYYRDTDGDGKGDTYVNNNSEHPESKMARTWNNPKILQEHIDEIINDAGIKCPDKCCCGNGKFDDGKEECDPKASPTGCKDNMFCTDLCKCLPYTIVGEETTTTVPEETTTISGETTTTLKRVVTPRCGDGYLSSPREECDMADHARYSNWSGAKVYLCPNDRACVNCKCVKLTPRCGDGEIYRPPNYGLPGVGGEECDPKATPTGCEEGKICTEDCKCKSEEEPCPEGSYSSEDCAGKCKEDESCELNSETNCYSCVKIVCKENSDCGEITKKRVCYNDDVYEQTSTPICYNAGTPKAECKFKVSGIFRGNQLLPPLEDCDPGYCWQGECVDKPVTTTIEETTTITETTTTTESTTTVQTCEDIGMYSSETACDNECNPPDQCVYHDGYDCWYCQEVECSGDLYDSSDCDGECAIGEVCEEYQDTGCYYCKKVPYCGDGIIDSGEQCEEGYECPEYHYCSDCQCLTDCGDFCASVGQGFTNYGGTSSSDECAGQNNPDSILAQLLDDLSETCYAVCGKGYFLDGLSDTCCCIKTNKVHCIDCPGQNPDCDTALSQCRAGIPM